VRRAAGSCFADSTQKDGGSCDPHTVAHGVGAMRFVRVRMFIRTLVGVSGWLLLSIRRRAASVSRVSSPSTLPGLQIASLGLLANRDRRPNARDARAGGAGLAETEALAFADRPTPCVGASARGCSSPVSWRSAMADPAGRPSCCSTSRSRASTRHQACRLGQRPPPGRQGLGVLAVLHDLNMAARYADRWGHRRKRPADPAGTGGTNPRSRVPVGGVATPIVRLDRRKGRRPS